MASMMISIEGVPVPRSSRTKPKLLVRGRRRRVLRKAVRELLSLSNQDFAEGRRAAVHNYTPYLILGSQNSSTSKAFTNLLLALQGALGAKA